MRETRANNTIRRIAYALEVSFARSSIGNIIRAYEVFCVTAYCVGRYSHYRKLLRGKTRYSCRAKISSLSSSRRVSHFALHYCAHTVAVRTSLYLQAFPCTSQSPSSNRSAVPSRIGGHCDTLVRPLSFLRAASYPGVATRSYLLETTPLPV